MTLFFNHTNGNFYFKKIKNRLLKKIAQVPNGNIQVPNETSISYIDNIFNEYNEKALLSGASTLYISPEIGLIGKELMDIKTGNCYFLELYLLQLDKSLNEIKTNLKELELPIKDFNSRYNFLQQYQYIICGIFYSCPNTYNNTQVTQKEKVFYFTVTKQQLQNLNLLLDIAKNQLPNNQNLEFIN